MDNSDDDAVTFSEFCGTPLKDFDPVSEQFVLEIIAKCPSKMCDLDPLFASVTNECIDDVLLCLTAIVNLSLSSGTVPDLFKHAIVSPLLNKHDLDPECLKNYHTVFNLPFLSKMLERVMSTSNSSCLSLSSRQVSVSIKQTNKQTNEKQHSTEIALLHMAITLITNADKRMSLCCLYSICRQRLTLLTTRSLFADTKQPCGYLV